MISAKLLGKVLNIAVSSCELELCPNQHGNNINFTHSSKGIEDEEDYINIYELANKCKEHFQNTELLHSYFNYGGVCCIFSFDEDNGWSPGEYFNADSEPEAIFKACQWILEKQKDN